MTSRGLVQSDGIVWERIVKRIVSRELVIKDRKKECDGVVTRSLESYVFLDSPRTTFTFKDQWTGIYKIKTDSEPLEVNWSTRSLV